MVSQSPFSNLSSLFRSLTLRGKASVAVWLKLVALPQIFRIEESWMVERRLSPGAHSLHILVLILVYMGLIRFVYSILRHRCKVSRVVDLLRCSSCLQSIYRRYVESCIMVQDDRRVKSTAQSPQLIDLC